MPEFAYRYLTPVGSVADGRMIAEDEDELESRLRARGEYLIEVGDAAAARLASKPVARKLTDGPIPADDLSAFTEYLLSSMLAGIPLFLTLSDVEVQVTSKRFRRIIGEVRESMGQEGKSLSEALAEHPKAFSEVFVCTIEAGEMTGQLDHALQQLADYLVWRQEIRLQLRQASAYPAIIFMILAGLFALLILFVYPRLLPVFESFDTALPLPTRVVLWVGTFTAAYWLHTVVTIVGLMLLAGVFYRTKTGRMMVDTIRLKLPIFGKLIQQIEMARLVTHLALFFRTGIDLLRGLEMLQRLTANRRIGRAIGDAREKVIQGGSLAQSFAATGLFPPIVLRGLALGEATGRLDETLDRTRAYYAREVPAAVRSMLTALNPLLLVIVGGSILFVALSIFLPILGIYDAVGR